ncbi:MAG: hypothetical protein ABR976_10480 [Terracidiphilus sp.]
MSEPVPCDGSVLPACQRRPAASTTSAPTTLNPALTNAAQQVGTALGQWLARSILGGGNSAPNPADVAAAQAQQQRAQAAHQLNESGIYLLKQRNYAGAINEFQQALAISPGDSTIAANLGVAKQMQKNSAVAGQNSEALAQLLGSVKQTSLGPNGALNLVNLGSDPNVVDLSNAPGTTVDPATLKGQLDNVFSNGGQAAAPGEPLGDKPQAQDIDKLFAPASSAQGNVDGFNAECSAAAPGSPASAACEQRQAEQVDAKQKQLDDLFKGSDAGNSGSANPDAIPSQSSGSAAGGNGAQATAGGTTPFFGSPGAVNPKDAGLDSSATPTQAPANQPKMVATPEATGTTTDSAALAQQARSGQMAVSAKTTEGASVLAGQGFDTAAPSVVVSPPRASQLPGAVASASVPSSSTYPSQSQPPPSGAAALPEIARLPITVMRPDGAGGAVAPGNPIFDCAGDRAAINRLAAGLPAQEEAVHRTVLALNAAKAGGDEPRKKAMFAALETMLSSAQTINNWATTVIAKVQGLKSAGIGTETAAQFKFLRKMNKILDNSNTLVGLVDNASETYKAGYAFGGAVTVRMTASVLISDLEEAEKMLVDSGLNDQVLEEVAAKVALYGFGPVGGLTAEALVHTLASGLNLYVNAQQAWNSAAEAEQAERDLTVMRYEQLKVRNRIYELRQELAQGCPNVR